MTTKIIAVRHGETEWNRVEKQQGQLNSNLTEQGRLQAKAIGDCLQSMSIDAFYSSDLGRALETSRIISEFIKIDFTTDKRLRERHLGTLQGLTKEEFRKKYPDEWLRFKKNDPDYVLPEGESGRQRYDRATRCVEDLVSKNAGKTLLLVSHGGVIMSFFYKTLNLPLHRKRTFSLFNGAINAFSISETLEWSLDLWGDTHHLQKYGLETLDDN